MKYHHAFILFVFIFAVFFAPVIFRGEVIFPHNNDIEVGDPITPDPEHISNGKFADESSVSIPEINFLLRGNHRSWLGTWTPGTEFGRPAFQFGGISKAYLPANITAFFTDDPFVFYSFTILVTVFLSGLFLFLLLKSFDLHPLACLVAAAGVSFGVYFTYWLTFNLFLSPFTWALGLMWLTRRFIQRPGPALALGLAFASYSLLMTGYPQTVLLNLYIVVGFALVMLWKSEGGMKEKGRTAVLLGGALFFGVLMTAPVYLDLMETAGRSARLRAGSDFFLKDFPKMGGFGEFLVFINSAIDPFVFGNPINEKYIFGFNWPALTPFYTALFILTFIKGQWRRLWPWQVFIFVCAAGTVFTGAYLFAVRYLGFSMSAIIPLVGIVIPAGFLTGVSADYLLRHDSGRSLLKKSAVFLSLAPLVLLYVMYGAKLTAIIETRYLLLNIGVIAVFYLLSISTSRSLKAWGLLALTLVTVFVYGRSLRLIRPESNIHTTSRVVEFIREQTGGGETRLAFVGYKNLVPPNQELLLGLKSIHAYDSLSSREYQRLVKKLSVKGTYTYGRHFDYITDGSRLDLPEYSYTGIGLYISSMELYNPGLVRIGQWRKYRFYKPLRPPIMEAQVRDFDLMNGGAVLAGRLEEHRLLPAKRMDSFTDYKTFSLTPLAVPSLLFVSQQYHPRWQARSKAGPLETIKVNDFYEGVILPPGTSEVVLAFRPHVLWMWVSHVIFIVLGTLVALRYLVRKNKREAVRA